MSVVRAAGALSLVVAVLWGTFTDVPGRQPPQGRGVIAGDFHVHGMPGDGVLPVWEIQREAARRGLDVIAVTNHNGNLSWRIARASGLLKPYPLVIPGEELTTRNFHIAVVGPEQMIDPGLPAREAIAAIHRQGGIAIAAHPTPRSWQVKDPEALTALDGVEAIHPLALVDPEAGAWFRHHYEQLRDANPTVAPIGSTDYHVGAVLGLCRTYLIVDEFSVSGVLDAVRQGRTVASGPDGNLIGTDENVNAVKPHVQPAPVNFGRQTSTWLAVIALASLAALVLVE